MIKATLRTRCGCERTLLISEGQGTPPLELRLALVPPNLLYPPENYVAPDHRTFRLITTKNKTAEYQEL